MAISKQPADLSRSAEGLRAERRATLDAMPLLQPTMSVSLLKGLPSSDGPVSSIFSSDFFFSNKADVKEFKGKLLS